MESTRDRASRIKVLMMTVPSAPSPGETAHLSRGQLLGGIRLGSSPGSLST